LFFRDKSAENYDKRPEFLRASIGRKKQLGEEIWMGMQYKREQWRCKSMRLVFTYPADVRFVDAWVNQLLNRQETTDRASVLSWPYPLFWL